MARRFESFTEISDLCRKPVFSHGDCNNRYIPFAHIQFHHRAYCAHLPCWFVGLKDVKKSSDGAKRRSMPEKKFFASVFSKMNFLGGKGAKKATSKVPQGAGKGVVHRFVRQR